MGRKESNQTKKKNLQDLQFIMMYLYQFCVNLSIGLKIIIAHKILFHSAIYDPDDLEN